MILALLITFLLNSCAEKEPLPIKPCIQQECTYVHFIIYAEPPPIAMKQKPRAIGNGECIVLINDLVAQSNRMGTQANILSKYRRSCMKANERTK